MVRPGIQAQQRGPRCSHVQRHVELRRASSLKLGRRTSSKKSNLGGRQSAREMQTHRGRQESGHSRSRKSAWETPPSPASLPSPLMGAAVKGGMYCERCDVPVAAQKTTHGVRNTLAVPTGGLTAKVERWHCPNCGGPVKPATNVERARSRQAERETMAAAARSRQKAAASIIPPDGSKVVVLAKLPRPAKKPDALIANRSMFNAICNTLRLTGSQKATLKSELSNLPHRFDTATPEQSRALYVALFGSAAIVEVQPRDPAG